MYPRFIQLIIQNQLGDLSTHTIKYTSPALTQKVFANKRWVGKGFSGVETPLFEGMLVIRENVVGDIAVEQVQDDAAVAVAPEGITAVVAEDIQAHSISSPSPPPQDLPSTSQMQHSPPSSPQPQPQAQPQAADFPLSLFQTTLDTYVAFTSRIKQLESDKLRQALEITKLKKRVKRLEKGQKVKVFKLRRLKKVGTSQRVDTSDDTVMEDVSNQGRMIVELDRDEDVELMGKKEEEKKTEQAKDIAGDAQVEGRQAEIQAKIYQIDMDNPSKVLISAASTIIPAAEPKISAATITAALVKIAAASTRQKSGVVIRDPKKESSAKTPKTKSKDKGKSIMVEEPKPIKKKQQVKMDEAYARKLHEELNQDIDWDGAIEHGCLMMIYVQSRGQVQFKYGVSSEVKGANGRRREQRNESINETPAQKAAKRRKLSEKVKEVKDLKQHLEIMPDEDDDVYTEATPLARKVPIVDYQIVLLNNKPRYKIIRVDGTHQL
nr:hypothetical protein [Tanacetum cinerariifolium]